MDVKLKKIMNLFLKYKRNKMYINSNFILIYFRKYTYKYIIY